MASWHPHLGRVRRLALAVLGPVLLALLVRATIVQAYHIPSSSMEDTLFPGDFLLAEKLSYGPVVPGRLPGLDASPPSIHVRGFRQPRPGEVVIFEHPLDPQVDLVKRVVATEGQVVLVRDKDVYVDGKSFPMPQGGKHVDPGEVPGTRDQFGPYEVPADHVFVMGDNRDNSFDSRFFGAVPLRNLRARPLVVYFSWDGQARALQRIRWRHLGPVE